LKAAQTAVWKAETTGHWKADKLAENLAAHLAAKWAHKWVA
jgi:hypothetical protein